MENQENTYTYIIVGGGMTADSAVRGIRQVDPEGSIALFSSESYPPYNRPPLSKGLWKRTAPDRIFRGTPSFGVDLFLQNTVQRIDPQKHVVFDSQGNSFHFRKLLLATGGSPIRPWPENDRLIYYRSLADYHRLRALVDAGRRFIVIGGGFIGSEIAAAIHSQGREVSMLFPEEGIGRRVLPQDLSLFLNEEYRRQGVTVYPAEMVEKVEASAGAIRVQTANGIEYSGDAVIAGLGIRPNIHLAVQAGLLVENGIRVNEILQTSHSDVYAAGDVAEFYNPSLATRMRVEHEEHANQSGLIAGKNMAGDSQPYHLLPSFYSDLFEISYQALGEINPSLDITADWQQPYQKGALYYLRSGRLRGVILWNMGYKELEAARALIAEQRQWKPAQLEGRISSS
jgi:NADPH-dependent 2,4-dienoyl-CoA reductase/sulfur reductase-like enzyme